MCPAIAAGKIHWRNTFEQLKLVGPKSMGVALLTAGFVGMVFTIQVLTPYPPVACSHAMLHAPCLLCASASQVQNVSVLLSSM